MLLDIAAVQVVGWSFLGWCRANNYVDHRSEEDIENSRIKRVAELQAQQFLAQQEVDDSQSI